MAHWYQVLTHFEHKGYVHNGLTIPFLCGCNTVEDPDEPATPVRDLIEEASSYGITLMKCGNIGQYVMGTLDDDTKRMAEKYKLQHHIIEGIIITDGSLKDIKDIEGLVNYFHDMYADDVSNGNYSWMAGDFVGYSEKEENRIKELAS
jgi:hypothetical protein